MSLPDIPPLPLESHWYQAGAKLIVTSLEQTDAKVESVMSILQDLLSAKVASIEEVGGGRNSRVHRLLLDSSRVYALKSYFQHTSDKRQRLETEFYSLRFLRENGIENVPKPVAANTEHNIAIYEWIDGQRMASDAIDSAAVRAAAFFLIRLQSLRCLPSSRSFQEASEACFSGESLVANIHNRLQPLLAHKGHEGLQAFLSHDFTPACDRIVEWSRGRAGESFSTELPDDARILSPSDFGFHNVLCCENQHLYFLDFEYFGWDDPAKTIADFLLHPGMRLAHHHRQQFACTVHQAFSFDTDLARRVEAYYPLFGLKWCLILLNEFLPDHLMRRQFATANCHPVASQNQQLAKAKAMLNRIASEYEYFPYFD